MIKNLLPTPTWGIYFKTRAVFIYWKCVNIFLSAAQFALYKKVTQPKRILVFRTGSLGDSICAIPAIISIRKQFPKAKMDILSNSGLQNLASIKSILNPNIYDNYIDYLNMPKTELLSILKKEQYDTVIELSQTQAPFKRLLRDMIFFRFGVGISRGFGWEFSTVRFLKKTQEKYVQYFGEIERLLKILEQNGVVITNGLDFNYNLTKDDVGIVEKTISRIQSKRQFPIISLVIGAKRPQNRWPLSYFKAIAAYFSPTYNLIVIGGPDDKAAAAELSSIDGVFNLCGLFTPIQSGLAINNSVLCISNDTGPMHLAYSFNVPVVALFSSRDFPNKWYPPENNQNVIFRNTAVHCSLCLSENCPNNICMQGILPDSVIKASEQLLIKHSRIVE